MMEEEEEEEVLFDQAEIDEFSDKAALLPTQVVPSQSIPESHNFKPKTPSRCYKVFSTICLCAAFLGLGLCIGIPGPTLLDLQQQTNTDTETISRIFTGRSVGYLCGSIFGGVLFDKFNQHCLLSLSLLLTATGTAIIPWCTKFLQLIVLFAFQGISMGFLDTGGNVLCVHTWGEDNGPWMQGLHFAFGVGAFVAPLIAEPFLSTNSGTKINKTVVDEFTTIAVPDLSKVNPEQNDDTNKRHIRDLSQNFIFNTNIDSVKRVYSKSAEKKSVYKRALASKRRKKAKNKKAKKKKPKNKAKSNQKQRAQKQGNNQKEKALNISAKDTNPSNGIKDGNFNVSGNIVTTPSMNKSLNYSNIIDKGLESSAADIIVQELLKFIRNVNGVYKSVKLVPGWNNETDDDNAENGLESGLGSRKRPRPEQKNQMPQEFIPDLPKSADGESNNFPLTQSNLVKSTYKVTTLFFNQNQTSSSTVFHNNEASNPHTLSYEQNDEMEEVSPTKNQIPPVAKDKVPAPKGNKGNQGNVIDNEKDNRKDTGRNSDVNDNNIKETDSENTTESKSGQTRDNSFGTRVINRPRPGQDWKRLMPNNFLVDINEKKSSLNLKQNEVLKTRNKTTEPDNFRTQTNRRSKRNIIARDVESNTVHNKTESLNDLYTNKTTENVSSKNISSKQDTVPVLSTTPDSQTVKKTSLAGSSTSQKETTLKPISTTTEKSKLEITSIRSIPESNVNDTNNENAFNNTNDKSLNKKLNDVYHEVKYGITYVYEEIQDLTTVQFAYLTIASYIFVIAVLYMLLCCSTKCTFRAIKMPHSPHAKYKESKGFKIQLLILLFIFFFLYVGMEITYGGLLLAFSVEYLDWTKSQGTYITSVFFGSFAAARGLTIFLAKCLSPPVILILDLVLTNLSLIALLITLHSNPAMIWYCNIILGIGLASIFPTGVSWAERYMDLTGVATSSFVVGSALGEMVMPAFTGFMFEAKGPMYLIYIMMGSAVLSIIVYIIMQNMASNSGRKYKKLATLRGTTLTELEHADLEMDSIPLTPDLDNGNNPSTSSDFHQQNGGAGKSRKKVTFNFKNENAKFNKNQVKHKLKGSILKIKGSIKND